MIMKKETKVQIIIICILTIILGVLIILTMKEINGKGPMGFDTESKEKQTKKEDIDIGINVDDRNINLNDYNSNINISEGGEYTIEGDFNYSLIIDTTKKVILNLNNVKINSDSTAAIVNVNNTELVINLVDGSNNVLSDNGSSEYDSCIYSVGKLIIDGSGSLNVYGNQEEGEGIATESNDITINGGNIYVEANDDGINAGGDGGTITINNGNITIKATGDGIDSNKNLIINGGNIYTIGSPLGGDAGIDTDEGFVINGGEVIALGSDMLEKPEKSSKQKSISFSLDKKIASGKKIVLKDIEDEEIISFEAKEDFKTLIISNDKITTGTYYLYIYGEKTEYKGEVK